MTYAEKINEMNEAIEKIYREAEALRDIAVENEKDQWNNIRHDTYEALYHFRKLARKVFDNKREDLQI